ncbi:hypothetical protein PIB30_098038, partial [Stylosanthes scabra]|nr:hypothetical protein [Stylosanthes scabra]
EKITQHLHEDQEHAATKGIPSKVLAHPNDATGEIYGPKNEKRVCGFSSVCWENSGSNRTYLTAEAPK